jgi:muramoyltetrapeptide carboxypeptidase
VTPPEVRKPRALTAGDTVGLVAPSGCVGDPDRVERSAARLEEMGFRVKTAPGCRSSWGYLAGKDEERARDLNALFADPEVAGIVCLKGGYGTPRILDAVDYPSIARHPKALVGYSDITGLHLALGGKCGLVTFHGPMPSSDMLPEFHERSRSSWLAALTATRPLGILAGAGVREGRLERLVGGTARGPIVGGNLSLVAATMGTPYEIDTSERILFLEDVDEAPYRVDRMLTQLRLAGKLDRCAGILLGDWKDCEPKEGKPSLTLLQVFEEVLAPAGKPVAFGFRAGHCTPALTFPLGVQAVLDADTGTLEIVETATA